MKVLVVEGQPTCSICGQPLSPAEVRLKVIAHFPCVLFETYKEKP